MGRKRKVTRMKKPLPLLAQEKISHNFIKDIDFALIEVMQEDIVGFNGQRSLLFVSKYQINPLMKVCTDIITL